MSLPANDDRVSPLAVFDDLMTEQRVLEQYETLLSKKELRDARRKNEITFVTGKKGQISYRPVWIASYLERKITKCRSPHNASGNTETTGSAVPLIRTTSMPAGGTSEQDTRAAEVLQQKFLPKLRTG